MREKIIAFIKAHILVALFLIFITCISPYIFYGVHYLLGLIPFMPTIKIDVYLNYMAIAFTGVPSAVIAIYALHVAKKSEQREQADKNAFLDLAMQELHEYISNSCHVFCDVAQGYRSYTEISVQFDVEKDIKQLLNHGLLTKSEADLCERIHSYVLEALDTSREKSNSDLANGFCHDFFEKVSSHALKSNVTSLLYTLSGKQREQHQEVI